MVTTDTMQSTFEATILGAVREREEALGCKIGLSLTDKDLDLHVENRGDELFHPASTMKVPVMIEVFLQAEEGRFAMTDTLVVDPTCHSLIDGSPFEVDARQYIESRIGQPETILRLTEEMIQVSDNLATNMLIELCGPQKITATMRRLGARHGYVIRPLEDSQAFQAGISNRLTPNDLTVLMEAIDGDTAASPAACEEMRRILFGQKFREMIPANLPETARVANKTGNITAITHDTAIVYAPFGTWYLTIFTDGIRKTDDASQLVAELSRLIWDEREKLAQQQ